MNEFWYIAAILGGMVAGWMFSAAARQWRSHQREKGKVPWARVRAVNAWGDAGGFTKHLILGVSRHHIAESGLNCPVCGNCAAERADYSRVQRMRVNGVENEVVECVGMREVENNTLVACGTFLLASPDTEHGDHLNNQGEIESNGRFDRPEFYKFKRITREDATKEEYDASVYLSKADTEDESLMVRRDSGPKDTVPTTYKHDVLVGEELQVALRAEIAKLASAQHDPLADTTPTIAIDPKRADTRKLPIVTPPPPSP